MPTRIFVNSQQHDTEITLCREEINFNSNPSFKSFKPLASTFFSIKKVNWFLFTLSDIQNFIMAKIYFW